jgi:hypothetical protein
MAQIEKLSTAGVRIFGTLKSLIRRYHTRTGGSVEPRNSPLKKSKPPAAEIYRVLYSGGQ